MACSRAPRNPDHDRLRFGLMDVGLRLWDAREHPERFPEAHDRVVEFCVSELLAHLERDEGWLVDAQHCPEERLLVEAIRAESRTMTAAVHELAATTDAFDAVALTRVVHTLLATHDHHEKLLRHA